MAIGERAEQIGAITVLAGSVLVAASGLFVWVEVLGSELTGFRMAELIGDFGDEVSSVPPPWVGAAWYLFPMTAAVCWILVVRRSPLRAGSAHLALGLVVAAAALIYTLVESAEVGPAVALVGGLVIAAGAHIARRNG